MKTNRVLCASASMLVAVAGYVFAENLPKQATPPIKASTVRMANSAKDAFPVIGYIEKRDRTITIKAGPKGPLYSVKTLAGKLLCENVSAEQLRAQAPELNEFLKGAIADSSSGKADARVRVIRDASLGSAMR